MQENYLENKIKLQNTLAKIIKTQRLKTNKSISLISAEIGMTKSMWADLEKGIKDPQLSTILRIAEGLNIPISSIIKDLENELGKNFTLTE